ncbi:MULTISPECIES: SIS domain-containing protein [unclassified Kitasatospora]|uniref:SIS domain-containing protein n=1 Tax=unclassified Kitasatospora TaxID=2633591 RepID=UPI003827A81F
MFDDSLLDDPAAVQRADRRRELLALAGAGARIRIALRRADAAGVNTLNPDGRPRAVLVAGHGGVLTAAAVLAALALPSCQVWPLPPADARPGGYAFTDGETWQLPGWANALDLIVVASAGGREGGLINLAEQAYARGCAIAVIAPEGSELFEAALQVRALPLPFEPSAVEPDGTDAEPDLPAEDPAALWAFLAPLLTLADRIGAAQLAPGSLEAAADRLDEVAVRCRPDAQSYDNPAKSLAARLAETVPLLWSEGAPAAAAGERFAAALADRAGLPALTARLPQALTAHRGMFTGRLGAGADPDDFFRDRVDEPVPLQLQVLMLRHTPGVAELEQPGWPVARARRLAAAHEVRCTEHASSLEDPVQALAELIGLTDFAAVYLGLATRG